MMALMKSRGVADMVLEICQESVGRGLESLTGQWLQKKFFVATVAPARVRHAPQEGGWNEAALGYVLCAHDRHSYSLLNLVPQANTASTVDYVELEV
jgi:hypothetical protein